MIMAYIEYILLVLFILFIIFAICAFIYRDEESKDFTGQSERQKQNDDYNNDYHP